jgi:hypothetical protein
MHTWFKATTLVLLLGALGALPMAAGKLPVLSELARQGSWVDVDGATDTKAG